MTKEKTNKDIIEEEAAKTRILVWIVFMGLVMFIGIVATNIKADTITFQFKSPSFNGMGTSSHYLTIENQRRNQSSTRRNRKRKRKLYTCKVYAKS